MSAVRQIGIKMTVDAQSVTTELPRISREFDTMGSRADQAAERTTRSLARVNMSVRDIIQGAAGLHVVGSSINAITEAIRALPREAFNYSKDLEVSQVGMAGILGSMTAINGRQTQYNQALQISSEYIRKLNDDALRTAASSQELTQVFQALMAPGLGAKMTLEEIRQLTVVGTNAVKSMGLDGAQVVQELRDLVAGGITAAGSTLATALGLKDSDIAKAKASSEGLFTFLMERLQGFKASSEAFNETLKGKLDSVKEGAVRVAAEGMSPLIEATKIALDDVSKLFVTFDENKNVKLNADLVNDLRSFSQGLADAASMGRSAIAVVWENREAVTALATAYGALKLGAYVAEMANAVSAKREAAQASRLLAVQQAAETAGDAQVVTSSRAKVAAYLAELEANAARARGEVAAQAAQIATLQTTREAIVVARADVVAKMDSTRATMAQAEAQIAAARAAGAQSMALALVREGTHTLMAAQAQHAALTTELAVLGRQQAGVQAGIVAATAAQTAATTAATAATASLTAAQSAASLAGRAFGTVVGALGGPVGIAITAVSLLAMWLYKLKSAADDAAGARMKYGRAMMAVQNNTTVEERDIMAMRAEKSRLENEMDELQTKGGKGARKSTEFMGTPMKLDLDGYRNQIASVQKDIDRTLAHNQRLADAASKTGQSVTLTVSGAEQAWRKANDGVKTASAIQSDYNDKLSASKAGWDAYKAALEKDGASDEKIADLAKEQAQNEKALAAERDKQIKSLSAGTATARSHGIDAEIAATKHGYKLLAAQTAESIADVESQRRSGSLGDSDALAKRTELQLADVDAQRAALQAELALLKGKKESAKEQANIVGELAELAQRRVTIETAAAREQREIDAKAADELEARITAQQKATQQTQENVRTAKLDQQEIGVTGAALGKLRQARVEEAAAQLESQARIMDGIDLSGRAGEALRQQAADVRELAKVQGYNASAKMVADYAKAVDQSNAATQFEQSLAAMSQRDRDVALEQYRIAIDLQEKLRQIDVENPNDQAAAQRLKEKATATAVKAQADAANRVYVRETTRTVDQINDVFRKGFADMVNEGEKTWDAFTGSLATSFKTAVADELYKAFAQPFVVPVVAHVQGMINGLIQGGANALGLAGGSNLLSTAGNASSIYSLTTGNSVLGQAANWLGLGGAASAGAATGIAAGVGSGLTLASTSAGLGLTGAATGTGLSLGLAGGGGLGITAGSAGAGAIGAGIGTSAAAGGTAAAGAGGITGALAAIPGWGWALAGGALLLSQMDLGSRGANHVGAAYSTSGLGNAKSAEALFGRAAGDWYDDLTQRHSADLEKQLGKSVEALSGVYKSLSQYAGDSAKQIDIVAGFASNPAYGDEDSYGYFKLIDKLNGSVLSEYTARDGVLGTDPNAAYTQFATEMLNKLVGQLRGSGGLEKWVDEKLAKLGDAPSLEQLAQAVEQINAAQAALTQFGLAMPQFAAQSAAARSALIGEAGGSDAFTAQLSSFYGNFFSEAERTAVATQQVTEELGKLGYAMPTSREEYRAWVTAAIEAGESGVKSAAGLLKLESAVAGLTQTSDAAAAAALQVQQESAKAASSLRSDLIGLEGRFENGGLSRQYQAEDFAATASALFSSVGIDKSVGELAAKIQTATSADVEQYFREMWSVLPTTEARQQLVTLSGALVQFTQTADDAAKAVIDEAKARADAIEQYRSSLGESIESARLGTMDAAGQASYLRGKEGRLWAQLDSAQDPVAVAQQLQQTIVDRIGVEAKMREQLDSTTLSGLQQQLGVAQSMRTAASSMQQTVDGLRLGGTSALNPFTQLQYAADKFDAAYQRAKGGDVAAWQEVQSMGQTYVQLGRDVYASSTDSADVFSRVTSAMDELVAMGMGADPQITALNTQIELLQTVGTNTEQSTWAAQQQLESFMRLDDVMRQQQERQQQQADTQISLMRQTNEELARQNELLQAQILQQATIATDQATRDKRQLEIAQAMADSARMQEAQA